MVVMNKKETTTMGKHKEEDLITPEEMKKRVKISLWQKIKIRAVIKEARKVVEKARKNELGKLRTVKENKILLIQSITGLSHSMNLTDEETGKPLTDKDLQKKNIDELCDIYETMVDSLEKVI